MHQYWRKLHKSINTEGNYTNESILKETTQTHQYWRKLHKHINTEGNYTNASILKETTQTQLYSSSNFFVNRFDKNQWKLSYQPQFIGIDYLIPRSIKQKWNQVSEIRYSIVTTKNCIFLIQKKSNYKNEVNIFSYSFEPHL